MKHSSKAAVALAVFSAVSLTLGACGSSTTGTSAAPATAAVPTATAAPATEAIPTATAVPGPKDLLPADIKASGVLRVGSNYTSPPLEYLPEGSTDPVGLDIDLMEGIAKALGVKTEWTGQDWAGLRPALQANRYDTVIASMGDFTDRQEQVTFVDYLSVGEAALVLKENAGKVTKVEDLAGLKVGASKGTIAATIADQASQQLEAQGLKPMQISLFSGDSAGILAVNSGQVFAHILDLPFAAYVAADPGTEGKYGVVLPNLLMAIPYGIAVNKDNMALAQAIQAALNQMIADGSYQQILDKWGLAAGAVTEATINGGTTSAGG